MLRANDHQHILALPLIRSLRQAGKDRSAGYGAALQNDRWEWTAAYGSEDPDVQTERAGRSEGQVDLTVFDLRIQHQFRTDLASFDVARGWGHLADGVVT